MEPNQAARTDSPGTPAATVVTPPPIDASTDALRQPPSSAPNVTTTAQKADEEDFWAVPPREQLVNLPRPPWEQKKKKRKAAARPALGPASPKIPPNPSPTAKPDVSGDHPGLLPNSSFASTNQGPTTQQEVERLRNAPVPSEAVETTPPEDDPPFTEKSYEVISRECGKTLVLCEDALHGLPGRIVTKLVPETESHPAALLVEILMNFGSIIGRTAYYEVEDTPHYGNISAVRVGQSSKGRKGTASARISAVFKSVDPTWFEDRRVSGLSSGEGLLYQVRDPVEKEDPDEGLVVIDEGVTDKRLLVREGEFGQALTVMRRDGNTLSPMIRNAWDSGRLQSLTRATRDVPLMTATGAHISIMGDITGEELQVLLSKSDTYNGFANRFLWVFVARNGVKPFGGAGLDWKNEIAELKAAVAFATGRNRTYMDRNARLMWHRAYPKLSEGHSGRFGAATSRAEAQVIRLALLYALLERSNHIRPEHLKAALAFWRYCEESARIIFGGLTQFQERLVEILREGPRTASQIREALHRNKTMAEILTELAGLVQRKVVTFEKGNDGAERYLLTERK